MTILRENRYLIYSCWWTWSKIEENNWNLSKKDLNCTKCITTVIFQNLYMSWFTHFLCVKLWFVKYCLRNLCELSHVWLLYAVFQNRLSQLDTLCNSEQIGGYMTFPSLWASFKDIQSWHFPRCHFIWHCGKFPSQILVGCCVGLVSLTRTSCSQLPTA